MDQNFLKELKVAPEWRILKREILNKEFSTYKNKATRLSSFQIIYALVDSETGSPIIEKKNIKDTNSYLIFTELSLASRLEKVLQRDEVVKPQGKLQASTRKLKKMMLGHLIELLRDKGQATTVKVNPVYVQVTDNEEAFLYAEEVLFAPQFDEVTQKYLITDPDDARALLAIRPEDEKRFGIEIIYYLITTRGLPEEQEHRESYLKNKIEELAFMAPRVPIKKGSGSFLAVILNLENDLEERAFIRDYPMFDDYSDSIFVTSKLQVLSGNLDNIPYNGNSIDTIFDPMIKWQRSI